MANCHRCHAELDPNSFSSVPCGRCEAMYCRTCVKQLPTTRRLLIFVLRRCAHCDAPIGRGTGGSGTSGRLGPYYGGRTLIYPSTQRNRPVEAGFARSGREVYCAVHPPSITNSLPVMKEDSREARNSAPWIMGLPLFPRECRKTPSDCLVVRQQCRA